MIMIIYGCNALNVLILILFMDCINGMKVNLNNVYSIKSDNTKSIGEQYLIGPSFIRRKNKAFQKKVQYNIEQCQLKHRLLDKRILDAEKDHSVGDYELRALKSQKLLLKDKITKLKNERKIMENDIAIDELGKGGFSKVLVATCVATNEDKAIKVADVDNYQQLFKEYLVLSRLNSFKGFPKVSYFGKQDLLDHKPHVVMIMDLLGPSLEKILFASKLGVGGFSSVSILKIASQLLNRLSVLSSFNIIHGDIHPGNFLLGLKEKAVCHLIDFGMCSISSVSANDDNQNIFRGAFKSIPVDNDHKDIIRGTLSFSSISVLEGKQYCEKDDLESLGYSLAFLLDGYLPWDKIEEEYHIQNETNRNFDAMVQKVIHMKQSFEYSKSNKASILIMTILNHARSLSNNDKPDYNMLLLKCNELLADEDKTAFDWINEGITWNDNDGKLIFANYNDII